MSPPLEAKPIGSLLEVILRRNVRAADPTVCDEMRELLRAVASKDSGRVDQVLAGIDRRAKREAASRGRKRV